MESSVPFVSQNHEYKCTVAQNGDYLRIGIFTHPRYKKCIIWVWVIRPKKAISKIKIII